MGGNIDNSYNQQRFISRRYKIVPQIIKEKKTNSKQEKGAKDMNSQLTAKDGGMMQDPINIGNDAQSYQ